MPTRTITILFCDLVGSTEVLSRLGDERGNEVRRDYVAVLREAVDAHGGTEVKSLGDGLMVTFTSAGEAVAAAIAMQRSVTRVARGEPANGLALRVGISVGEAAEEDGDWFGTPVVEAARLCATAEAAEILAVDLLPAVMRAVGSPGFEPIGARTLKGLSEPVAVCRVAWQLGAGYRPPLPAPLDTTKRFVFVGRPSETSVLADEWERTLDGRGDLVLLAGEPGIGKTRLAAELARRVHRDGAVVLYGRCDEEVGVAYQPFVEALQAYASGCPSEELREMLGTDASALARLLPVLSERLGIPRDVDDEAEGETGRYRMFEAVTALISRLSVAAPVLLVLDDLQWAAKPTLLMLRQLVRSDAPRRLLVVGAFRDTDLDRTHPLADMLADLRREQQVRRLDLEGLNQAEVSEFVETAAGHTLDASIAAVARAVYTETEGNPFFVGQLLRHLTESGALVKSDGHWVTSRPLSELGIPEGVRELIGRRLSRLSRGANEVMGAASVIGREFDTALLIAVSGASQDEVLDALEAAERARLIALVAGRLDRFAFVHTLVRSTLYDELPTTRRLRLHRRSGLELEARGPSDREGRLVELAHHFFEAAGLGEVERAVRYGRMAGNRARAGLAFEQAAGFYEGALSAMELLDEPDRSVRAELKLALGDVLRRAGEEQYRPVVLEVVEEARSLGDGRLLAEATLGLWGIGTRTPGTVDVALIGLMDEALAALGTTDNPLRARLLAARAVQDLNDPHRLEQRLRLSAEAVEMARRLGNASALARVLAASLWGAYLPEHLEERRALAQEVVGLANDLGDDEARLYGHMALFGDHVEVGDLAAADRDLATARAVADELRQTMFTWAVERATAARDLLAGRLDLVEAAVVASSEAPGRGAILPAPGAPEDVRCLLHWEQGRFDAALSVVRQAIAELPPGAFWPSVEAMLLADAGCLSEARVAMAELAKGPALARDPQWLATVALQGWLAATLQDRAAAERLLSELDGFGGRLAWNGRAVFGVVDLVRGRLSQLLGRVGEAEACFEAAVDLTARAGAPRWAARVRAAQSAPAPSEPAAR